MRIAARASPESAARSKKSWAEAMSPAARKASPRTIRAAISEAEGGGPPATDCGAGSGVGTGGDEAPRWSALVATGSRVVVVSPAEAALGGAAAMLAEDEPVAATGAGAIPRPAGASDGAVRDKTWSRTRPTKAPS